MNIYGLKGLIKAMEIQNKPEDRYMLQFYKDLYDEQLKQIADKVQNELDDNQKKELYFKSKSWNDYLAK
jgi:hypothetical protein